jgi:WD40 repeat protein
MRRTICLGLVLLLLVLAAVDGRAEVGIAEVVLQRTPFVATAVFSPDGKWLATAAAWVDSPGVVKLRDVTTGREQVLCKDHSDAVMALTFTCDGKALASGDYKGTIKVWDTATGKETATFRDPGARLHSLAFSPDGKLLASAGETRTTLWDLAAKRKAAVLDGYTSCVVFSPDGRTLVCGPGGAETGQVVLWDVATGKQRAVCQGHNDRVLAAAFAPDGQTLATASRDCTARLWSVATGRHRATLQGHKGPLISVAYSPDGRMLASACAWQREITNAGGKLIETEGTEVKVWEVATHGERLTFEYGEAGTWLMHRCFLQFTSDGKGLVGIVNRPDSDIKRWDLAKLALTPR